MLQVDCVLYLIDASSQVELNGICNSFTDCRHGILIDFIFSLYLFIAFNMLYMLWFLQNIVHIDQDKICIELSFAMIVNITEHFLSATCTDRLLL